MRPATDIVANCKPTIIKPGAEYALLEELHKANGVVATDTETVGIDPRKQSAAGARTARIVAWSLAYRDSYDRYRRAFLWADSLDAMGDWLERAPLIGHNLFGFDFHMFANHGIHLGAVVDDTLERHRFMTNGKSKQHGLKHLLKTVLGIEQPSYVELFSRRRNLGVKSYKTLRSSFRDDVHQCTGGEYSVIGASELIPLDRLRTEYPQRLLALYEYATLDALGCLLLRERLCE